MALIEAQGVHLLYGRKEPVCALDGIDFHMSEGEALALTGPSGCGKSSLLAVLGGMQRPTAGRLLHRGRDVYAGGGAALAAYRAEHIGFVFQQPCLLPQYTLLENVLLPVDHLHAQAREWTEQAHGLLAKVGLSELAQRRPHEVSGGQAQRAAIARALLRRPALILADEPTAALDRAAAAQVLDLLLHLNHEGTALVLVTHEPALAARLPRQLALQAGRMLADSGADARAAA